MFWTLVETYMQLKSFTIFIWSSSHLPCFFRLKKIFTLWAFCCVNVHYPVIHTISKDFQYDGSLSHQMMKSGGEICYGEGGHLAYFGGIEVRVVVDSIH